MHFPGLRYEERKEEDFCVLALHVDQTIPNRAQPKRSYILFLEAHSKAFPPCSVNKCLFVFIVLGLNLGLCVRQASGLPLNCNPFPVCFLR